MDTKRFELTDAEIGRIIGSLPDAANEVYPCLGGGYFHTCCHYQEVLKAQTRQETLREVGKWLETRRVQCTSPWNYYIVDLTDSDIEALKRGEMPEQSGT